MSDFVPFSFSVIDRLLPAKISCLLRGHRISNVIKQFKKCLPCVGQVAFLVPHDVKIALETDPSHWDCNDVSGSQIGTLLHLRRRALAPAQIAQNYSQQPHSTLGSCQAAFFGLTVEARPKTLHDQGENISAQANILTCMGSSPHPAAPFCNGK